MFMDIFGIKQNDDTTRINDLTLILSFSLRSRPLKAMAQEQAIWAWAACGHPGHVQI